MEESFCTGTYLIMYAMSMHISLYELGVGVEVSLALT